MRRRRFLAVSGTALGLAVAGCTGDARPNVGENEVGMTVREFVPAERTVTPGTSVVFRNTSSAQHTVTAYGSLIPEAAAYFASGGFDSQPAAEDAWRRGEGGLVSGEAYEHTFVEPGRYEYFCIPHETAGMKGVITVESADNADAGTDT